jgi:thiamine-monophosphate kinase
VIHEFNLIDRIARATARRAGVTLGIGDDAAVLDGDPPVVVTQDLLVQDVHFRLRATSFRDLGHKALAVNLSDLAAMGARPVAALVGLGLPDDPAITADSVLELYAGMEDLAAAHEMTIAGGDVTRAPVLTLAVVAIGHAVAGVAPVRRSGAAVGDVLCVTGALGAAAAGLLLVEDPSLAASVKQAESLREALRRPMPRVAAGQALAAGGATAMLDCSDGLALDASRIAVASGVCIELQLERVPVAPGVASVAATVGRAADELAATGGEDYELIVTLPPGTVDARRTSLDVPLTAVGRVIAGPPGIRVVRGGAAVRLPRLGWEHTTR